MPVLYTSDGGKCDVGAAPFYSIRQILYLPFVVEDKTLFYDDILA